jgi:hypothetical protein
VLYKHSTNTVRLHKYSTSYAFPHQYNTGHTLQGWSYADKAWRSFDVYAKDDLEEESAYLKEFIAVNEVVGKPKPKPTI